MVALWVGSVEALFVIEPRMSTMLCHKGDAGTVTHPKVYETRETEQTAPSGSLIRLPRLREKVAKRTRLVGDLLLRCTVCRGRKGFEERGEGMAPVGVGRVGSVPTAMCVAAQVRLSMPYHATVSLLSAGPGLGFAVSWLIVPNFFASIKKS